MQKAGRSLYWSSVQQPPKSKKGLFSQQLSTLIFFSIGNDPTQKFYQPLAGFSSCSLEATMVHVQETVTREHTWGAGDSLSLVSCGSGQVKGGTGGRVRGKVMILGLKLSGWKRTKGIFWWERQGPQDSPWDEGGCVGDRCMVGGSEECLILLSCSFLWMRGLL